MAAQKDGERPINGPKRHPNVAPTKKVGTISPPLYPAPIVRAVNSIFKKKASGTTCPSMACSMVCIPAPL